MRLGKDLEAQCGDPRAEACVEMNRNAARAILDIWPVATDFQRELARLSVARNGTEEDKRRLAALEAKEEKAVQTP